MTLDCLIVNPAAARANYQGLADREAAVEPPVWCRIIAGYLRERGFDVAVADMEVDGLSPESLADEALRLRPRLAVVVAHGHQPSASTQVMGASQEAVAALEFVGVRVLLVGGHVSALPENSLLEGAATWVCDGEGPITAEAILNHCPEDLVPGLVWLDGGRVRRNDRARLLNPSTSDLEGDAWDIVDPARYRAHNWQCLGGWPRSPYASLYTSLGCPFKCSFCMINAPFHANLYRARRPDRVAAEIVGLFRGRGVRTFKIADEMFVLKPSHYMAICDALAAERLGDEINAWCYARVDTVRADDLPIMRRAGFRWLALGIEAADGAVRDGALKALKTDDVLGVVRAVQAAGIGVIGNFMFGLPGDTSDTMEATLRLALDSGVDFANFYSTMAYPGSALAADTDDDGRPWTSYAQHSRDCRPLGNGRLSPADVLRFRDGAHARFFSDARFLDRTAGKFGPEAAAEMASLATPLARDLLGVAA